jgi:hypothetical protein
MYLAWISIVETNVQNAWEVFLVAPLIFLDGSIEMKGFFCWCASFCRAEIGQKKDGSPNVVIRPWVLILPNSLLNSLLLVMWIMTALIFIEFEFMFLHSIVQLEPLLHFDHLYAQLYTYFSPGFKGLLRFAD